MPTLVPVEAGYYVSKPDSCYEYDFVIFDQKFYDRNAIPVCEEENCPIRGDCKHHTTAGDYRSEGGVDGDIRWDGTQWTCSQQAVQVELSRELDPYLSDLRMIEAGEWTGDPRFRLIEISNRFLRQIQHPYEEGVDGDCYDP
jgi:hypothetical protein